MRNTKKAFTLVELIVVITILAILGTIAFISLQGYSSDARNSKRTSDLGSIISKMTIEITKGVSLLSFVGDNANELTGNDIAGTGATAGTDYTAGAINYLALDMKKSEFQDPVDKAYVMGVTTKAGAKYQVAATLETGGGAPVAKIKGNWISRDASGLSINTGSTDDKTVTLAKSNDSNKFKVGDYIDLGGSQDYKITKVSDNGMIITLDPTIVSTDDGALTGSLSVADTNSLIGAVDNLSTAIVEDGTDVPYKIN